MSYQQHLTEKINLKLDKQLKADLEEFAQKGDRKLQQEIRRRLRESVEAEKNGSAQ